MTRKHKGKQDKSKKQDKHKGKQYKSKKNDKQDRDKKQATIKTK